MAGIGNRRGTDRGGRTPIASAQQPTIPRPGPGAWARHAAQVRAVTLGVSAMAAVTLLGVVSQPAGRTDGSGVAGLGPTLGGALHRGPGALPTSPGRQEPPERTESQARHTVGSPAPLSPETPATGTAEASLDAHTGRPALGTTSCAVHPTRDHTGHADPLPPPKSRATSCRATRQPVVHSRRGLSNGLFQSNARAGAGNTEPPAGKSRSCPRRGDSAATTLCSPATTAVGTRDNVNIRMRSTRFG